MDSYDTNAIDQFLGDPLILEEGQQCEYTSWRGKTIDFYEEAIGQLLCFSSRHFFHSMTGKHL